MKRTWTMLVAIAALQCAAGAFAADIADLDRVGILMPRATVSSILGPPEETMALAGGLIAEVYSVDSPPLVHSGCIYNGNGIMMGQSFVFQGRAAAEIAERLKRHGFAPVGEQGGAVRYGGVDDDSGLPLVAVIDEKDDLTTLTTFEKAFYEAHLR